MVRRGHADADCHDHCPDRCRFPIIVKRVEPRPNRLADMHGENPLRHVETDQFLLLIANRHTPGPSVLLNVDELARQASAQNDVADDSSAGRRVHDLPNQRSSRSPLRAP
jgi:hypothetical protein